MNYPQLSMLTHLRGWWWANGNQARRPILGSVLHLEVMRYPLERRCSLMVRLQVRGHVVARIAWI